MNHNISQTYYTNKRSNRPRHKVKGQKNYGKKPIGYNADATTSTSVYTKYKPTRITQEEPNKKRFTL